MIKELLIGLLIGLLFGIPFWAAEVAGELIDLQRGSTMEQLVDPLGQGEASVMATLLTVMLITLFFMSGGFILMVDGYYHSYQLWPVTEFTPLFSSALPDLHSGHSRPGDAHWCADGRALADCDADH